MIISPSLLAADSAFYGDQIRTIQEAGAQFLHIDVMDGHFVPNLSFGPTIISKLRRASDIIFDVHLMIEHPEVYAQRFIEAGADYLTIHAETINDPSSIIKVCANNNVKFGLAVKPQTDFSSILDYFEFLDLLLIMGIEPGGEGKSMEVETPKKIAMAKELRKKISTNFLISVDGGVNNKTGKLCFDAGADVLVAGSYIFNSNDPKLAVKGLLNL
jgi:ribulose-phosphate 3-epimerase